MSNQQEPKNPMPLLIAFVGIIVALIILEVCLFIYGGDLFFLPFGLMWIIIAMLCLLPLLIIKCRYYKIRTKGNAAVATAKGYDQKSGEDCIWYYPLFAYEVDGKMRWARSIVGRSDEKKYARGQKVNIHIVPGKPRKALADDEPYDGKIGIVWLFFWMFAVVGIAFLPGDISMAFPLAFIGLGVIVGGILFFVIGSRFIGVATIVSGIVFLIACVLVVIYGD